MRIVYISVDGTAKVEKTRKVPRLIEMPDGYHPVTNDSVWQDSKRIMEPVLVIPQGVRAPLGGTMEADDIRNVLYEIKLQEMAFKSPRVSKMWMRTLEAIADFITSKGLYIGFIFFILYFVADSVFGGG